MPTHDCEIEKCLERGTERLNLGNMKMFYCPEHFTKVLKRFKKDREKTLFFREAYMNGRGNSKKKTDKELSTNNSMEEFFNRV